MDNIASKKFKFIENLLKAQSISELEAKLLLADNYAEFNKEKAAPAAKNILVTGGAGFIGSNFIHYMLEKYPAYNIVNLDALTYAGNLENLKTVEHKPRYRFYKGDIRDEALADRIIKENRINLIVHFAAESHVDRSIDSPDEFLSTNVMGTNVLLKAALKNGNIRFHHVSTDEVFGALGLEDPGFHEASAYDPRSPYSASKASSDHLVRAFHHTYDLPVTISNCSNNYGPFMHPEKFFPLAITNLLEGKKVPLYGDGLHVRDWLYVYDHCRALDLIVHKGRIGHTYCVGAGSERSNLAALQEILKIMDYREDMIEYVRDRRGHDRRYAINYGKLREEFGWEPLIPFRKGLERMVDWYRSHRSWWQRIKSGEYRDYYRRHYGG